MCTNICGAQYEDCYTANWRDFFSNRFSQPKRISLELYVVSGLKIVWRGQWLEMFFRDGYNVSIPVLIWCRLKMVAKDEKRSQESSHWGQTDQTWSLTSVRMRNRQKDSCHYITLEQEGIYKIISLAVFKLIFNLRTFKHQFQGETSRLGQKKSEGCGSVISNTGERKCVGEEFLGFPFWILAANFHGILDLREVLQERGFTIQVSFHPLSK